MDFLFLLGEFHIFDQDQKFVGSCSLFLLDDSQAKLTNDLKNATYSSVVGSSMPSIYFSSNKPFPSFGGVLPIFVV